ncbi:DUF1059 domain-containing protein [Geopsychrobacter electrodiphilus]|uniref:DUF1059 domain-containing protein n=1 Tax=Geopsychrobacter electrodiphilus TaxID=225196 RepID=UPI000365B5E2|nr:DUF1059 domain-containing protein [Geopsychrobacter electrodiphilus]
MGRKYVECRHLSGDTHCPKTLVADSDNELMEAVIKHAINAHGLANTSSFRKEVSTHFKEGNPPL